MEDSKIYLRLIELFGKYDFNEFCIGWGLPPEEYDIEAKAVYSYIQDFPDTSVNDLAIVIQDVFAYYLAFCEVPDCEALEIANDIYPLIKNN